MYTRVQINAKKNASKTSEMNSCSTVYLLVDEIQKNNKS